MGKKSVKLNKNIYQLSREKENLTREKASAMMEYISADRIEKIESEKSLPHPDEILAMSKCYKAANLCNYFCSHECPIGQQYVPEVQIKDLSQIVLEMLASMNALNKSQTRLIEITVDGQISEDEMVDFVKIQKELNNISMSVDALQMWIEEMIHSGKIDENMLKTIQERYDI